MHTYISPEDTHQGALKLSAYGNFAKCHQAHFRVTRVGLGTRLLQQSLSGVITAGKYYLLESISVGCVEGVRA